MASITSLYLPGAMALWCALIFALASLWGYSQALGGREDARDFARRAYALFAAAVGVGAWILFILLMRRDFRIEYVYAYSGLDLPLRFQLAAFWAGQKGSFLLWLGWGAVLGLPLRKAARHQEAPVMAVYLLTLLGLLFILVRESPFLMLPETPIDGQGLNPLLQDNWMVIHPPIIFVGFAASAIPFAFATAALWRRDTTPWARLAFPWALVAFLSLGVAILLGGYWAYKTLGWGGYWGWDPVENASLIPLIFAIVLIHGLYMERTRGRFRRSNFVFAGLFYLSILYATFLTRSGVLADFSVHSFVDLGISAWLVALMAFFGLSTVLLWATRLRGVPTERNEDPLLSRGSALVLAAITLTVAGLVIAFGTSAPILTRWMPSPGQVGPEFYNRVNLPIALLLSLLLALVPYLTWRGTPPAQLWRRIRWPAAAAAAVLAGAVVLGGVRHPLHLLFVLLAALALAANLDKTVRLVRRGGLGQAGGYLAHVGMGMMLLGFLASSAYQSGGKVTLEQGEPQRLGDLELTFEAMVPPTATEKQRMRIQVVRAGGSTYHAHPQMYLNPRTRQLMAHPDVRKLLLEDIYVSPIEFDPGTPHDAPYRVEIPRGGSATVAGMEVTFRDFDLSRTGDALAQMQGGGSVAVAAIVEVRSNEGAEELRPLYRFASDGRVDAPALRLATGAEVRVAGINAAAGTILLDFDGLEAIADPAPARLSVDVSHKPLMRLVWYGVWVVLVGGLLAVINRFRQVGGGTYPPTANRSANTPGKPAS